MADLISADNPKPDDKKKKKPDDKPAPKPGAKLSEPEVEEKYEQPSQAGICHERARAVPGLRRYFLRACNVMDGDGYLMPKYALAPNKTAAEELYLQHEAAVLKKNRFDPATRRIRGSDGEMVDLDLRCQELAD